MRTALLVALMCLAPACSPEDEQQLDVGELYTLEANGPSCPTADRYLEFGIAPRYHGADSMALCEWYCLDGQRVLLRFLRDAAGGSPWQYEGAWTGACVAP